MKENKSRYVTETEKIAEEIRRGDFGKPGEIFTTTRRLAEMRGVALVTAQQMMTLLKEQGLITLLGKTYYLNHGVPSPKSPLGKKRTKTGLIGMHVTNLESPFFASLARDTEVWARQMGYQLVIASSGFAWQEERDVLQMFRRIGVDGVISCPGTGAESAALYRNFSLPLVFLGRDLAGVQAESVSVNNYAAARSVARHFIREGYAHFVYIGLDELREKHDPRLSGFREMLCANGYDLPQENILYVGAKHMERLKHQAAQFLHGFSQPTAVFCFHDLLAVEVLKGCAARGIAVPEQVAVAGFDNLAVSESAVPPLTTVSYRVSEMARMAVRLLEDSIRTGNCSNINYFVEPMLMIRKSSKKDVTPERPKMDLPEMYYTK